MPTRHICAAAVLAAGVSLCAALSCATAASAQPAPSPAPTPKAAAPASPAASPAATAAPTPSPTPYKLITINGYGDAGYTAIGGSNAARFVTGTPSRVFDASTGPFIDENGGRTLSGPQDFGNALDLQNANLQITLNGPFISGKIETSFGTDADVIASNGQSRSGSNLTQAYLQAVRGPFTVVAGKFETEAGAEVIESPSSSDFNYSRSYLFGYAIPFTHTGVRVTYALNPKLSIVAGANDGWDDWKFVGKKKTLEGALLLTPTPGYALTLDTYNGNDFAVTGNTAIGGTQPAVFTNRMLYDGVLTVHPTGALTLVANYDNGTQLADGTGLFSTAHWNGFAGYLDYQFTPVYGLAFRKETFGDPQGFRTSLAQRVQSSTATFNYSPGTNYLFRLEYRLDASDVGAYTYRGYPGLPAAGRPDQSSIGVETIVKFP